MQNYIFKWIYIITFILLFCFQTFVVPFGNKFMLVSTIFLLISFATFLIFDTTKFLKFLKQFFVNKYVFNIFLFIIWVCFSSTVLVILNKTTWDITCISIFTGLVFSVCFPLFFGFLFAKKCGTSIITKTLIISLFIILLYGLIEFIAFKFNITIVKNIWTTFNNQRALARNISGLSTKYFVGAFPRTQSFFVEPGLFSYFIALMLPLIYRFSFSKKTFFRNKTFDKIIKKTFIPLTLFDIITAQSPIGLIFFGIISLIYYIKNNKLTIKKIYISLIFLFLSFIVVYIAISNLEGSRVFERFYNVYSSFGSLENLTKNDESFATRIILYVHCILIAAKNIILGVGWGHLGLDIRNSIFHSGIPITYELIETMSKPTTKTGYGLVISYRILAETGIIGFLLFFNFVYQIYLRLKKYIKKYLFSEDIDITLALYYYTITFTFLSFYESLLYAPFYWIVFGLAIGIRPRIIKEVDN